MRRLRVEAAATLLAAKLAIKFGPFRWLIWWMQRPPRLELQGLRRERARSDVSVAVEAAAQRLPGMVCFPKAVAAQSMLRRRGVSTTIYFGAGTMGRARLSAHVWLADGESAVTGSRSGYPVLARYSGAIEAARQA